MKVWLLEPAEMVTLEGTVAREELLLERLMTAPPLGAGALSVTVPIESSPPLTVVGLSVTEERLPAGGAGVTLRVAVRVTPLYAAEMVTELVAVTETVVTVNVAVVAPAGIETLAGTVVTAGLELVNVTTAPPLGAALVNVAVPCEEFPPVTVVGFSVREERLAGGGGGVTESVALLVTLL